MYCSQCGKKVVDNMLFCPFCGSPIVIPEQDAAAVLPPQAMPEMADAPNEEVSADAMLPETTEAETIVPNEETMASEPEETQIHWSDRVEPLKFEPLDLENLDDATTQADSRQEEEFTPLNLDFENDFVREDKKSDVSDEVSDLLRDQIRKAPSRTKESAPVRKPADPERKAKSMVSMRNFDPNDIFMDGSDYDDEDDAEEYEEHFEYEEPEQGSFLIRHIRGFVALSLFFVMLAVIAGWTISDSGQLSLAQVNLAWRASAYERLGYDAYQNGKYVLSGNYYEKALAKDADNFGYAYSAGVAYYAANDIDDSAQMGKRAIQIDKSRSEAYELLLRLYPDASERPWEITELIQQGYRETGNESFNIGA